MKNKLLLGILILFSLVGFLASSYLTAKFYLGETPTCSLIEGCETVLTSKYSQLGPFSTSLFGVLYFLPTLILALLYLDSKKLAWIKLAFVLSIFGFLASLALLYLQFFVLRAICIYCLTADISSIVVFVTLVCLKYTRSYNNV